MAKRGCFAYAGERGWQSGDASLTRGRGERQAGGRFAYTRERGRQSGDASLTRGEGKAKRGRFAYAGRGMAKRGRFAYAGRGEGKAGTLRLRGEREGKAGTLRLPADDGIDFDVVTFDRDLKEELKGEADTDFDRGSGDRGKKSVVKPSASTEAVPVGRKGQPGNNNEIQTSRTSFSDRLANAQSPRTKIRELRDGAK